MHINVISVRFFFYNQQKFVYVTVNQKDERSSLDHMMSKKELWSMLVGNINKSQKYCFTDDLNLENDPLLELQL